MRHAGVYRQQLVEAVDNHIGAHRAALWPGASAAQPRRLHPRAVGAPDVVAWVIAHEQDVHWLNPQAGGGPQEEGGVGFAAADQPREDDAGRLVFQAKQADRQHPVRGAVGDEAPGQTGALHCGKEALGRRIEDEVGA